MTDLALIVTLISCAMFLSLLGAWLAIQGNQE